MFNKIFIQDVLERALSTAAQTAAALLSVDGLNLLSFDLRGFGVTVGLAFILSVLKSLAGSKVGNKNDASLVK